MKKNLFYLFALICSMSLFTACSDDDDPDYSKVIEEERNIGYQIGRDYNCIQLAKEYYYIQSRKFCYKFVISGLYFNDYGFG